MGQEILQEPTSADRGSVPEGGVGLTGMPAPSIDHLFRLNTALGMQQGTPVMETIQALLSLPGNPVQQKIITQTYCGFPDGWKTFAADVETLFQRGIAELDTATRASNLRRDAASTMLDDANTRIKACDEPPEGCNVGDLGMERRLEYASREWDRLRNLPQQSGDRIMMIDICSRWGITPDQLAEYARRRADQTQARYQQTLAEIQEYERDNPLLAAADTILRLLGF